MRVDIAAPQVLDPAHGRSMTAHNWRAAASRYFAFRFFQTGHIGAVLGLDAMRCVHGVLALALMALPASLARADGIRFLPDDAQIACRAILPQCSRNRVGIASAKTIQPLPKRIGGLAAKPPMVSRTRLTRPIQILLAWGQSPFLVRPARPVGGLLMRLGSGGWWRAIVRPNSTLPPRLAEAEQQGRLMRLELTPLRGTTPPMVARPVLPPVHAPVGQFGGPLQVDALVCALSSSLTAVGLSRVVLVSRLRCRWGTPSICLG